MKTITPQNDSGFGFQIAPMIDVVFVIMLFFMVMTGGAQTEHLLKTTLPTATIVCPGMDLPDEQSITIRENGQVALNEEELDAPTDAVLPNLTAQMMRLRQNSDSARSSLVVTVTASEKARYERVVAVLNALGKARVTNVAFETAAAE